MRLQVLKALTAMLILGAAMDGRTSDGVLEINQACAVAGGCFDGDEAGFPVTVTQRGSYRLTSSLSVSDPNTHVIDIQAGGGVNLDLNGFLVVGPSSCGGSPPNCNNTGTGHGITTTNGARPIRVANGTIFGIGSDCVNLSYHSTVENLVIMGCGGDGIVVNSMSVVNNNNVRIVAGDGIRVQTGSLVQANTSAITGGFGLIIESESGYGGNVLVDNTGGPLSAAATARQIAPNVCGSVVCP